MTLQQFRQLVRQEFGEGLRHMTPSNVREFIDQVENRVEPPVRNARGRFVLNEDGRSYEGIVHDFLYRTLELPPEQAVIRLWLFTLELANATVNELEAEKF
ncbi:MAG: hypothetical protein FJX77_16000, partial [Armatimonadetes bacterium]|nr:hypothetical protein [Armatimonadota bacterium]